MGLLYGPTLCDPLALSTPTASVLEARCAVQNIMRTTSLEICQCVSADVPVSVSNFWFSFAISRQNTWVDGQSASSRFSLSSCSQFCPDMSPQKS